MESSFTPLGNLHTKAWCLALSPPPLCFRNSFPAKQSPLPPSCRHALALGPCWKPRVVLIKRPLMPQDAFPWFILGPFSSLQARVCECCKGPSEVCLLEKTQKGKYINRGQKASWDYYTNIWSWQDGLFCPIMLTDTLLHPLAKGQYKAQDGECFQWRGNPIWLLWLWAGS